MSRTSVEQIKFIVVGCTVPSPIISDRDPRKLSEKIVRDSSESGPPNVKCFRVAKY